MFNITNEKDEGYFKIASGRIADAELARERINNIKN